MALSPRPALTCLAVASWLGSAAGLEAQTLSRGYTQPAVPRPPAPAETLRPLELVGPDTAAAVAESARVFAEEHPELVASAWELARRDPEAFRRRLAAALEKTPAARDRAERATIAAAVSGAAVLELEPAFADFAYLVPRSTALAALRAGPPATYATVFAKGDVKGVATGEVDESTVGTGALGLTIERGRLLVTASLNVASSVDTIPGNFGEILLNPSTGNVLRSGLLEFSWLFQDDGRWGVHWYGTSSASNWRLDDTTTTAATAVGSGATLFVDLARGRISDTPTGLRAELGLSLRYLAGDVTNVPEEILLRTVGTDDRWHWGLEGGFGVTFGPISGALHYYGFPGGDEPLPGLSSGQLTVAFQVAGDLVRGELKP